MPRRTGQAAYRTVVKDLWTRIRLLLRNPDFRNDLIRYYNAQADQTRSLNREEQGARWIQAMIEFQKKWKLDWVPLQWPLDSSLTLGEQIKKDEEYLFQEIKNRHEDFPNGLPVKARDPDQEELNRWTEDVANYHDDGEEPPQALLERGNQFQPGTKLILTVDLSYPKELMEDRMKVALNNAFHRRASRRPLGRTPQSRRQRLDKIDFQIEVYDLVRAGQSFQNIARSLGKPLSTIKSSFLSAVDKIGDPFAIQPENHGDTCTQCQRATSVEEMCETARRYANQDYQAQREFLGGR